jgi:hypothetical protein
MTESSLPVRCLPGSRKDHIVEPDTDDREGRRLAVSVTDRSEVNVDAELVRWEGNITYAATCDNGITVDCP